MLNYNKKKKKNANKNKNTTYPFPTWANLFPGAKDSDTKCETVGEAIVCLISLILDH